MNYIWYKELNQLIEQLKMVYRNNNTPEDAVFAFSKYDETIRSYRTKFLVLTITYTTNHRSIYTLPCIDALRFKARKKE